MPRRPRRRCQGDGDSPHRIDFPAYPASAASPTLESLLDDAAIEVISARWHECRPDWKIQERTVGDEMLFYILDGPCSLRVGGEVVAGRPGDCLFLPAGIRHSGRGNPAHPLRVIVVHFLASNPAGTRLSQLWANPHPLRVARGCGEFARKLTELCREYHLKPLGWRNSLHALFWQALMHLLRECPQARRRLLQSPEAEGEAAGQIAPALRLMQSDLAQPWPIPELARHCHLSEPHFRRLFLKTTGLSPIQYLQRVRVRAACLLLRQTSATVADIAARTGYSEPSYFSAMFRRHMQVWPGEYRKLVF